jgi:hypothetical protein
MDFHKSIYLLVPLTLFAEWYLFRNFVMEQFLDRIEIHNKLKMDNTSCNNYFLDHFDLFMTFRLYWIFNFHYFSLLYRKNFKLLFILMNFDVVWFGAFHF